MDILDDICASFIPISIHKKREFGINSLDLEDLELYVDTAFTAN